MTADTQPGFGVGRLTLDAPGIVAVVREVIDVAGRARVRAVGSSMWPTIRDGSLVTLEPCPAHLRAGQIVLLEWGGRPVLHRVIKVDATSVYTAGDSCLDPDPPTERSRVCAIATSLEDGRGIITLTGSAQLGVRSLVLYLAARTRLWLARRWRTLRRPAR